MELVQNALKDTTVTILMLCGVLSIGLDLVFSGGGDNGWLDGAAILLAVLVVVGVSAVNDYQKELQFRQLSDMTKDFKVLHLTLLQISHDISTQNRKSQIASPLSVSTGLWVGLVA